MKFPLIVKWAITDKCNFSCKHCYRSQRKKEISRENANMIIEELHKERVGCVAITGGEPLMAKEFIYIINSLHEKGIETEIATNGYFITKDIISLFKKNGISTIQISLEGYNSEQNDYIRGCGTFEHIVRNIRFLVSSGINVVLANTLNHANCKDIDNMVKFANDLRVAALRFEIYIPIRDDINGLRLDEKDMQFLKNKFSEYSGYKNIILPVFHSAINCGAGEYMTMINSDMTVSPCDLLCDHVKSELHIDNEHSIKYIWQNDLELKKWRQRPFDGCMLTSKNHFTDYRRMA
ncbi:radical SAM/SPASM domain-containing protein [Butyrivibrio sp. NC3005]|uniref:radical SAM/SPASM domain-containing protein n=1 Tax=Butyrivibrio sp. NC3005 TaxID=1280685 RepID=UPI0003F865B5|nr:radical SAM protein [Butyrivibrio sp. NC3005]